MDDKWAEAFDDPKMVERLAHGDVTPRVFEPGDSPLRVSGTLSVGRACPDASPFRRVTAPDMPTVRMLSIDWRPDSATAMITITQQEYADIRVRSQPLSAAWHDWDCVTKGLPDPRKAHPVLAAIGRKGDRV